MKLPVRLIDSHVHFYDSARQEGVSWPPAGESYPAKALPTDLAKAALPIELAGVVLVETGCRPSDDEWLLKLANNSSLILGVIANLQPLASGFEQRLEKFGNHSMLKGIRLRPIDQYDLKSPVLKNRLKELSRYKLTLELGATSMDKLEDYIELAKQMADTVCGLTHFGHPVIDGQPPAKKWRNAILQFSALPNTFCKFTSLETLALTSSKTASPEFYRPTIDFLLSAFGQNRIIFGSNWPHSSVVGRYTNNLNLYQRILGEQTNVLERLFFQNAELIYRLRPANIDA